MKNYIISSFFFKEKMNHIALKIWLIFYSSEIKYKKIVVAASTMICVITGFIVSPPLTIQWIMLQIDDSSDNSYTKAYDTVV